MLRTLTPLPIWWLVYNFTRENKKPPTKLFLSQSDPVREKAKPYKASDVLPSAESDSAEIHDMVLTGRAEICRHAHRSVILAVSVDQWTKLFEESFKGNGHIDRKMKSFALRLSKSPPEIFGELWQHDSLGARDDTRAWKAAYNLLGASWNLRKKIHFAAPGPAPTSPFSLNQAGPAEPSPIDSQPSPASANPALTGIQTSHEDSFFVSRPQRTKDTNTSVTFLANTKL